MCRQHKPPRDIRAAVILAIEDGHILLVEQFRIPLGVTCLEK
jgi:ADP-ribose pyrophosphatase